MQHSFGWPLGFKTGGGSFLYHLEDNLVAVGFVVHLNYKNPIFILSRNSSASRPTRPSAILSRAASASHRARAITEGGYQSVPKLTFPGGVLIGCSAGLVDNVPRIKGSHNAVLVGHAGGRKDRGRDCRRPRP